MIELTRRYRFSASHRLHAPALSPDANRALYGKCNNPYGHGHNYTLDVTLAGPIGPDGRLEDPRTLDALVSTRVLAPFDHRHLNAEVPEFATLVPTTENLALVIARRLAPAWQGRARLARIRLEETANNFFELELGSI
jgi:6-pyruvoyltetrahydropterin/6-carboxytetrahydropterin synthase